MTDKERDLLKQIDESFCRANGDALPCPPGVTNLYKWLDEEAPYSILAHNGGDDPHFIYANQYALSCFKYTKEEMLALPSRLSAAEKDRKAREELLETVKKDGIAYDYSGPRVDKDGNTFNIYDGIVWELRHEDGTVWGQGALFWTEKGNQPRWYLDHIHKKDNKK